MPQVTIYLDDKTEKFARKAAKAEGLSLNKWIASAVREKAEAAWPKAVLDLEGGWADFPTAEDLRQPHSGDLPREEL